MRPLFFRIARIVPGVILAVVLLPIAAFAAADIGKVISLSPGASVLRDGKTDPLALHAGIRVSDTVQTDAAGRVKILFNDDSSVSLGPDTVMDMNEYADAGSKSAFGIHVSQGMVRAITGKIVEQNPNGFKMASPEATVGIRGTIVTMHVRRGQGVQGVTTVYVENTLRRVYANNENVPSGNKWTHAGGISRQERITPEDRRRIGQELAFRGGSGSAAAAPEATRGEQRRSTEQFMGAGGKTIPQNDGLQNPNLITQNLSDNLRPPLPLTGHVTGVITYSLAMSPSGLPVSSSWGFDVNLQSGAISNGYLSLNTTVGGSPNFIANFTGGTGAAHSTGFQYDMIGGQILQGGVIPTPMDAWVRGNANLFTASSGQTINVDYWIWNPSGGIPHHDSGQGVGTFTQK